MNSDCKKCAEYGSDFCNECLKETEMNLKNHPNCGTPDCCGQCDTANVTEGVNDPSTFKAIFLAGGPGSGKSFIVGKTALTALGFKVVNSDMAFERGLKVAGLDMTPDNIYSPKGQDIRKRAKVITKSMMQNYLNGRLGIVIDGTGKDYDKIEMQAIALRKLGYDVAMIFINTDEETALQRNRERQRSLPDATVSKMWKDVQKNLGKFQTFFGNFFLIDNSSNSNYQPQVNSVYKKISSWSKVRPSNKAVSSWLKAQTMKEELMTTADAGIPRDTKDMGPRNVLDKRKKKRPVLLKRFRKYMEDNA